MTINIFAIIAGSISMLTALCAVWISYKVYLRQKSFENENHFFKYKIEQYQQLISSAYELMDKYQEIVEDGKYMIETAFDQETINELADDIDDKTEEFRKDLNKFTLFMPQEILDKLELFYDNLYKKAELEGDIDFDKIDNQIDPFNKELDEIVSLMREDIGIDLLNKKLNKRIKK